MKPILIEFSNKTGYPFQIWAVDEMREGGLDSYDVEYSKTHDALFCDMSGGDYNGQAHLEYYDNKYWLAPDYPLPMCYRTGEPTPAPVENRLLELPEKYQGDPDTWLEEDHCYYCPECDDWLPLNDGACEHLWECDECDAVNWPGEECGHEKVTP
jgi:hypothetical protein